MAMLLLVVFGLEGAFERSVRAALRGFVESGIRRVRRPARDVFDRLQLGVSDWLFLNVALRQPLEALELREEARIVEQ